MQRTGRACDRAGKGRFAICLGCLELAREVIGKWRRVRSGEGDWYEEERKKRRLFCVEPSGVSAARNMVERQGTHGVDGP